MDVVNTDGGRIADAPLKPVDILATEQERAKPRLTMSGPTRGTQIIGYGKIKIDGSNDRLIIDDDNDSLILGDIDEQDDSFGLAVNDSDNNRSVSMGKTTSNTSGFAAYDDNNMRMLAGKYPNGDVKIKLSQQGKEVTEATDDELIWSSDFNLFKIVSSGTATLSYDGNVNTFVTVAHGLDYIPIVLAYVQFPNDVNFSPMQAQYVPMPVYQSRTGLPTVQCIQSADATNIYLRVHDLYASGGTPMTYNFRYYALRETAN